MKILKHLPVLSLALFIAVNIQGQEILKPGFDAREYADLLGLTHINPRPDAGIRSVPFPENYQHLYRSEPGPLDNVWDLYLRDDGVGVVEIRGTTARTRSWLENFYAGMVPATGSLQTGENQKFNYKLSADSLAAVHAGWLTGLASMAEDITEKLIEYHKQGVKEYILMGHSQGGAIVFLLDSYLHYDVDNIIPDDMAFKTYSSAAPKPGNLHYSYDYDYINRGGWAIRVVNPIDWVPETPLSVQTLDDFNEVNPFSDMETFTSSLGWLESVVIKSIFRKTDRSLRKARKRLMKYLGWKMFNYIENYMTGMVEPAYFVSMNYVPAGMPVILPPTDLYYREYLPKAKSDIFRHHLGAAYYFLLKEHYPLN